MYIERERERSSLLQAGQGISKGKGLIAYFFSESSGFGEGSTDTSDMAWNDALRKRCTAKGVFWKQACKGYESV